MSQLILEDFLPYRLNRLGMAVSKQLQAVYKGKLELTVPEWRVLATLAQYDGITAKTLGTHSSMHKTKVSRAVDALEQRRWLLRTANTQDRREAFLSLTKQGLNAYASVLPDLKIFENNILARLGTDQSAEVLRALAILENALVVKTDSA